MAAGGATPSLSGTRFQDVRRFAAIDSTNSYLLGRARAGDPEGVVAVADHQTAGRGRLGRRWESPPGSALLVSVLLRPTLPLERLQLVTAVAALAAADACSSTAGLEPGLKWPNDLVVGDRKLAGVLAEADLVEGRVQAAVVGLGLNLSWPDGSPAGAERTAGGLERTAVSLSGATGRAVGRDEVLIAFLSGLESRYGSLATFAGQAAQARDYRSSCVTLGRRVRVELADEHATGTAADVTEEGHLIVDVGTCFRTIVAGDVVHVGSGEP